ncbi:MAG TPA: VOC family protein [Acidimicrobiales bacterium]|nr:VOC family protein [Acidimicrobiales bacterium]
MPELVSLDVADEPGLWEELGFAVERATCFVGGIGHRLGRPGRGVVAWTLRQAHGFGELPEGGDEGVGAPPHRRHRNGVIGLDHIVVATPDLHRTIAAFELSGMPLLRTRETGTPDDPLRQAFFKVGQVVVEVVGTPTEPSPGEARIWGLTYTVGDLDATADFLGPRLRPVKVAVQPGRRIATLDRSFGSTVPIAFMSAKL